MKPPPFEYCRPHSVEETLELLAEHGDEAKLLAGGQSLIPTLNFRLSEPAMLLDLNGLAELDYIRATNEGGLAVGAMTRQRVVERSDLVARLAPLLREAMPYVAHPQIRNRGTVGGSVAHADPAAELPAVFLALDASFVIRGPAGSRTIPAGDFFKGLFWTSLEPEDLLVEIRIPPQGSGAGFAFDEVARRHGDYALAGVAATLELDGSGRCAKARIALHSVTTRPIRAGAAEAVLREAPLDPGRISAAAEAAAAEVDPRADLHASPDYRRQLVRVLVRRVLTRAARPRP